MSTSVPGIDSWQRQPQKQIQGRVGRDAEHPQEAPAVTGGAGHIDEASAAGCNSPCRWQEGDRNTSQEPEERRGGQTSSSLAKLESEKS